MVTTTRNWTISPSSSFFSSQDKCYQEHFFRLYQTMVSGGWAIESSSNGNSAVIGDIFETGSATNIKLGVAGSGAWFVASSPKTFATGTDDGSGSFATVYFLLATDDALAPYQQVDIKISNKPYTGGSISSLPTTNGTEGVQAASSDDLYPFTGSTGVTASFYSAYSDRGDIIFACRNTLRTNFSSLFMILGNHNDDGGSGFNRYGVFNFAQNNSDIIDGTVLKNGPSNWLGIEPGGDSAVAPEIHCSVWESPALGSFGGSFYDSSLPVFPINIFSRDASNGRWMGKFPDLYGCKSGSFGQTDDDDFGDPIIKMSAGDLWLLVPTGTSL